MSISAIVISGGWPGSIVGRSVEVLSTTGSYLCSLPDLPESYSWHTQAGLVICGGQDSNTWSSCLTFSSGQWNKSQPLKYPRSRHISWMSQQGLVLMGGNGTAGSLPTTEILSSDGQSTTSFSLRYTIRYQILFILR